MRKLIYRTNHFFYQLIIAFFVSLSVFFLYLFYQEVILVRVHAANFDDKVNSLKEERIERNINLEISNTNEYDTNISRTDFRAYVFDTYFASYGSPLEGLGHVFVEKCDYYGAPRDCIAIIGIAHYETVLCTYGPSQLQKNCWGYGGAGENRWLFNSYEEAIDVVTYRLVNYYGQAFLKNPEIAEMTYCGPRASCSTWGDNVVGYMNRVNNLSIEMGFGSLYDLRNK